MPQANHILSAILSAYSGSAGSLANLQDDSLSTFYETVGLASLEWLLADIGGWNSNMLLYWPLEENVSQVVGSGVADFPVSNLGAYYVATSGGLMSQITASMMRFEEISNVYWGLVEGTMSNLFAFSEEFGDTTWFKQRASIALNVISAPNGHMSADKVIEDGTVGNSHQFGRNNLTLVDNTFYSLSIYAKAAERIYLCLYTRNKTGAGSYTFFDLTLGTIGSVGTDHSNVFIKDVGSGWYRVGVTFDSKAGASAPFQFYTLAIGKSAPADAFYNGDSVSGMYFWGAQIETFAVATSYYPRTSVLVTVRASEAGYPTVPVTNNFNQAAGTTYLEWIPSFAEANIAADIGIISVRDNLTSLLYWDQAAGLFASHDGTTKCNSSAVALTANSKYFIAVRWWSNIAMKPSDDANNTGIQIGYSADNGVTWSWGTRVDYAGAFALGSDIRIHYANSWPARIRNIRLYGVAFTQAEIEGGVDALDGAGGQAKTNGLFNHNFSSSAQVTLEANNTNYRNDWVSPLFTLPLTVTEDQMLAYLDETYRFWRLKMEDGSNPEGKLELGYWFLGTGLDAPTPRSDAYVPPSQRGDVKLTYRAED